MIYGIGSQLGFTPREVDLMSLWEFECVLAPHLKETGSDGDMSEERLRALGIKGF